MIDFPIPALLDDSICIIWLERHLYPDRRQCPLPSFGFRSATGGR
jgi:hypothetical protein